MVSIAKMDPKKKRVKKETMDIIIKINTDNEAFTDNETQVMKEIISNQINKIGVQDFVYLYDPNGNKVGSIEKVG